jgi:uncharacterized protein (TIGR02271 family)
MQTQDVIIRSGAEVIGPDGPIGTIAHVVVDESTREISELVVRRADGQEWVIPTDAIIGCTDDMVSLRSDWSDLRSRAHEYAPDEFDSLVAGGSVQSRDSASLELREEELRVRKQTRELGAVELRKDVVAERHVLDIPVTHEELILERQPVDPPEPTDTPVAERLALRVVLREEVAVADKQPVVTEAVRAGRRTVRDTQHIETTVRKEIPDVRR